MTDQNKRTTNPETTKDSVPNRTLNFAAVAFCLVFPTIVTMAYFVWFADKAESLKLAFGIGKVLQFGFPVVFAWLFIRERIGLPKKSATGIASGFVFGLVIAVLMVLLYAFWLKPFGLVDVATEKILTKVTGFGITSGLAYLAMGAFYSVAHSLLEEYYWRWFVFAQLRPLVSKWTAIMVSSLGFMAHHVIVLGIFFGWANWLTYVMSFGVAVGGAVWAWLYEDSDSLLGPWLSHALIDAGIFAIGYDIVKDSFT